MHMAKEWMRRKMKDADVDNKMEVYSHHRGRPRMVTISAFVRLFLGMQYKHQKKLKKTKKNGYPFPTRVKLRNATRKERRNRRQTGDIHNAECRSSFGGVRYKDGMTKIRR